MEQTRVGITTPQHITDQCSHVVTNAISPTTCHKDSKTGEVLDALSIRYCALSIMIGGQISSFFLFSKPSGKAKIFPATRVHHTEMIYVQTECTACLIYLIWKQTHFQVKTWWNTFTKKIKQKIQVCGDSTLFLDCIYDCTSPAPAEQKVVPTEGVSRMTHGYSYPWICYPKASGESREGLTWLLFCWENHVPTKTLLLGASPLTEGATDSLHSHVVFNSEIQN